jgi:photosystem II stability/assembly factor-like uncharacterized protein
VFVIVIQQQSTGQWVAQNSGTTVTLTGVVMLDSSTAVAVGLDRSILKTTNAGVSWLNIAAPLSYVQPWNDIFFSDPMNGIVVGEQGGVVITTNGGDHWTPRYIPGSMDCYSALQFGSSNIYVGADSGWIYHSLDSGKTWTSEKISNFPVIDLFTWRGVIDVWGLPIFALTPLTLYSKMEFPSGPWSEIAIDIIGLGSRVYKGEFCNGGGIGFIVGVQGDFIITPKILRKTMSDTVWRAISTVATIGLLFGVSAPSVDVIYACGSGGMIIKTTNGGDAWSLASVPTKRSLRSISFINAKQGFAIGDSGTILYTNNGGITGINGKPNDMPSVFTLFPNYPNPFNPTTTISFGLPSPSFVNIEIYNTLGQKVQLLISEAMNAGYHTLSFDAKNLPSGIYFYRLQAGSRRETKKMMLMR